MSVIQTILYNKIIQQDYITRFFCVIIYAIICILKSHKRLYLITTNTFYHIINMHDQKLLQ